MSKKIDIDLLDDGSGGSHYAKERKDYQRDISGRLDRLRRLAVVWLLGMYYGFPWLGWDGRQAVLFDLPARKFHVFGLTFWPQDFSFLAMLLIVRKLDEPKAASMEALLREILIQSPQRFWLRFWPRG